MGFRYINNIHQFDRPRLLLFHQPHLSDLGNRNITVNQIPTWNWVNNWMWILWIFIWTAFMHTLKSIKLCNKLLAMLMVSPSSLWSWKKYDLRPYDLFGMCFFRRKCSMRQKKILGLKENSKFWRNNHCSLHIRVHVDWLFHLWSYSLRDNYFKTFLQCYEKITVISIGEG